MLKTLTLTTSLLALLSLTNTACGAEDDLNTPNAPYDIRDLSIARPGIYKTSVEIVEDNCTPSLKQLLDSRENFPPSSYLIYGGYLNAERESAWGIRLRQFHMRPGNHHFIFMPINELTCAGERCTGEFNWTDNGFPNRCVKIENWTAKVSIDKDRASVLNEIEWTPLPCEIRPGTNGFNHTPQATCREKYWMHSDYEKQLDCDHPGFITSSDSNGYGGYESFNSPHCLQDTY